MGLTLYHCHNYAQTCLQALLVMCIFMDPGTTYSMKVNFLSEINII